MFVKLLKFPIFHSLIEFGSKMDAPHQVILTAMGAGCKM